MPMVELSREVFEAARVRAAADGYATVDAYVADVLADGQQATDDEAEHLFTPKRLARIDAAYAEARRGEVVTAEQAKAELAVDRAAWLRERGR